MKYTRDTLTNALYQAIPTLVRLKETTDVGMSIQFPELLEKYAVEFFLDTFQYEGFAPYEADKVVFEALVELREKGWLTFGETAIIFKDSIIKE